MTEQEVLEALGHLVAVTNGWEDEATIDEYVRHLIDLDSPLALKEACISIARGWDQLVRPSPKVILDSYDRELVFHKTSNAIDPVRIHCDGSSVIMVHPDDGPPYGRPCPRCSPALAAVVSDIDKADQYLRDGAALEHVSTNVERVAGRLRYRNGFRPPRCQRAFDEPEDLLTMDGGRAAAKAAYVEAFPDRDTGHVDDVLGIITKPVRRRRGKVAS